MPILWYGERGVINALSIDLVEQDAVQPLLEMIQWADGGVQQWTQQASNAVLLVEHGFAQFGSPDLVIAVDTTNFGRHVVFIEAKVVPFEKSAVANSGGMGRGFNSTINGQLSLRYRAARALATMQPNGGLVEPHAIWQAYRRPSNQGGLSDSSRSARHLDKAGMLDLITEHGLHGLPASCYHFVAMTRDDVPFWDLDIDPEFLPLFLNEDGNNVWEDYLTRVGWLGLMQVGNGLNLGEPFRLAVRSMVPAVPHQAAAGPEVPGDGCANFINHNLAEFPGVQQLFPTLRDAAQRLHLRAELLAGSLSISFQNGGLVVGKLLPVHRDAHDRVLIGFSPVVQPMDWCPYDLPECWRVNHQTFLCRLLPDDHQNAINVASEMLQMLANLD